MTPPTASSNSTATVDLKSTDSGAAAGQSFPLATAPSAGAVPVAPSSEAPGAETPEVKPAELGPPYFGCLDLAVEDKVHAFDLVSTMVCDSVLVYFIIFIGGTAVLPMGVAPEVASKRSRLLAVS